MDILYVVCSWGLGHATRSLPIIRRLISEGHAVTMVSHDRALRLLEKELGDAVEEFVDIPDYPNLVAHSAEEFMAKSLVYWPKYVKSMREGHEQVVKQIERRGYDLVISDGRYDGFSRFLPSFFISHQMRILNPLRIASLEKGSEVFNNFFLKYFDAFLVPDVEEDGGFSGELGHSHTHLDTQRIHYVGVLSDFKKRRVKKDIDYLISITGPEPHRSALEKKLLDEADVLEGKVVASLGKAEMNEEAQERGITTYSFLSKEDRELLLNRSKMVVSRSGYSTILDLAVIGSKALFIPTPGQVEQEYLGEYHTKQRTFLSVDQNELDLARDVERAKDFTGITRKCDVNQSVENVMQVIFE